jgi:predicted NACHT family NTPase
VLNGVSTKLNSKDLDKALKKATKSAHEQQKQLFIKCEPGLAKSFLEQFFTGSGLQELQKPLNNQGTPQIDFLVTAFKAALTSHPEMQCRVDESAIEPWMKVFVETYFAQTNNYLAFQVAKEDYFKQLINYFDDVKFAGIAVEGQEIEKSENLPEIFVMPDVVEDVRSRLGGGLEQEFLLESISNRQTELLREQRQRSHLDNRTGRKFSAAQLLSQSQSHKVVLLGAPGSGKTTSMSYLAVILALKQPEKLELAADTDWLPILIRIRDLATQPDMSILDFARHFAEKRMQVKTLPAGFDLFEV